MRSKEVNGMVVTPLTMEETRVTIKGERTGNFVTISLADEDRGLMLQVDYNDIKKLVDKL